MHHHTEVDLDVFLAHEPKAKHGSLYRSRFGPFGQNDLALLGTRRNWYASLYRSRFRPIKNCSLGG
jgi:hypothetical protein